MVGYVAENFHYSEKGNQKGPGAGLKVSIKKDSEDGV